MHNGEKRAGRSDARLRSFKKASQGWTGGTPSIYRVFQGENNLPGVHGFWCSMCMSTRIQSSPSMKLRHWNPAEVEFFGVGRELRTRLDLQRPSVSSDGSDRKQSNGFFIMKYTDYEHDSEVWMVCCRLFLDMAFVSNHGTIFPPSGYVGRVLWCLKKLPMSSEVILFSPDSRVFNKFIQVSAGFLHVKKVPARFWQCFKNVPTSFFIFLFQVVSLVCTTRLNHWRLETLESPILGTMKIWNPGFFDSWNLSDQNLPMNLANSNLRPSFDGPEISDKIRTGFFIGILYWASEMPINMKHTSRTAQIGGGSFKDRTP